MRADIVVKGRMATVEAMTLEMTLTRSIAGSNNDGGVVVESKLGKSNGCLLQEEHHHLHR